MSLVVHKISPYKVRLVRNEKAVCPECLGFIVPEAFYFQKEDVYRLYCPKCRTFYDWGVYDDSI